MYTKKDWERDGDLRVKIGDMIDQEVFYQLRDCVPPKTLSEWIFQVGEAHDHDEQGNALYTTFKSTYDGWMYCGHCRENETIHREGLCERLMREYENNKNK